MVKREVLALVGAATIAFVAFVPSAGAATIVVTGTDDEVEVGGICSLREAVIAANKNEDYADCPGDTAGVDTIILVGGQNYVLDRHGVDDDTGVPNASTALGDLDVVGGGGTAIVATGGGLATIDGNSSATSEANQDRVIDVRPGAGPVSLDHLKITGGFVRSGVGGGGILAEAPLSITESEVTGNAVNRPDADAFGGGVYVRGPGGKLTMTGSTVAENTIDAPTFNKAGIGGGIAAYQFPQPVAGTKLILTNNTISGNSALQGIGVSAIGGLFAGDQASPVPAALTNNTITLNSHNGIEMFAGTMSGNIVAGNPGGSGASDCGGTGGTSLGGNLIGDRGVNLGCDFSGPNDLVGTHASPISPMLGVLGAYGGPTRTHYLNPGSPAIDRGGSCPATDQRGVSRPQGTACDAGAFELEQATPTPTPTPPTLALAAPAVAVAGPTGLRAAALAKCKKKPKGPKRQKCKRRANQLPI